VNPRRRSRELSLLAVPVLAAAFAACGGNDSAYCVDRTDRIVENRYCDDYINNPGYYWYYGGHVAHNGYRTGALIGGGNRVSTANVSENIKRGGFGSSSHSSEGGVGRSTGHSGGG
jgi:hypothetical protein